MSNPSSLPDSVDDGFAAVVVAYLQAREAGQTPTRAEWLDHHPEYATELAAFFEDHAQLEQLAQPLREVGRAAWSGSSVPQEAEITVAETEPAPVRAVGRCCGDYEVLEEIARGGMGVVYKARQKSLNRLVALKVIRAGELASAADVQRFRQEAETIALLDHPHIVPVHEVGEQDSQVFFAMKLIEGGRLADRAGKGVASKAEQRWAARLVATVARAIHHAHQRGVLHRDLKPSNILLDEQGRPHVTDFGLAKRVHADCNLTQSGAVLGTPSYMAPEQARGEKGQITTATDVYGLGAVLYTLLTGRPPFQGDTVLDTVQQVQHQEPEAPRRSNPALNRDLETICLKCLQKEPAQRYASADALVEDLQHWLEDRPIQARRPTLWPRLTRWSRRHKSLVASAVAVALLGLLMLGATIGWVAKERAARREALQKVIGTALSESADWQQRGLIPDALSAARRASGLLAGADVSPVLMRQVQARLANLELVDRLQEIRLERGTAVQDGHFDWEARDHLYAETLGIVDVDLKGPSPEVVTRLRSSGVPIELAAALDDWAAARRATRGVSDPTWKALLRLACLIDSDKKRTRVRQALAVADQSAIRQLAASADVVKLPPATIVMLARSLDDHQAAGGPVEILLRAGQHEYAGEFWINVALSEYYSRRAAQRGADAVAFARVAVGIRPESPGERLNLGLALDGTGQFDEAIAEYRQALRLRPNYAEVHNDLGLALFHKGSLESAIAEYRKAIRLKKGLASAHNNLGTALMAIRLPDKAIAEFSEAVGLKKDFAGARHNLGTALYEKGQLPEAIAQLREAVRLEPDLWMVHLTLGAALAKSGQLDESVAEFRRAIRLNKDDPGAHNNLATSLREQGRLDEAIIEYREAIRLNKDYAEAHHNLGNALRDRGQFREAIAEYRAALQPTHAEGAARTGGDIALRATNHQGRTNIEYRESIRQTEEMAQLNNRLADFVAGRAMPKNTAEKLGVAQLCQRPYKALYAASARWYHEAFIAQPRLADDLDHEHRYNAACAAALAGCGKGADANKLMAEDRVRLRGEAHDWLQADLGVYAKLTAQGPPATVSAVRQRLEHWQQDDDLAGVRGEAALAKLPELERARWRKLWADVAGLLAKTRGDRSAGAPPVKR